MPSSPASERSQEPGQDAADDAEAVEQRSELGELQERYAQLDDRYKRALADLDNYRKRSARLTESRVAEAREGQLLQWLETVDSVERALQMEPDGPMADGLRGLLDQMDAILVRQGVVRLGIPGEAFDPERHEAIGVRDTHEVPDHTVLDIARSGYAMGDRILRPAQVIVSRARGSED
jgi:molecular chaperone GrpE